jgi:hypothetical protein
MEESRILLQIELDKRNNKFKGYKLVSKDDILEKHPCDYEVNSWAANGRIGTRYELSTRDEKLVYTRLNSNDESSIKEVIDGYM